MTPLWGKCEDETHSPKSGNLKSYGTLKNSELDCKGQNTSHWSVLYTVGKVLKCRCLKWPCMSHSDIYNTSYGRKEGIDPIPVCAGGVKHTVGKLSKRATSLLQTSSQSEVWTRSYELPKVPRVQTETVLGLLLGNHGTKSHSDVSAVSKRREYYMGEGDGFPRVRAMVSQVSPCC